MANTTTAAPPSAADLADVPPISQIALAAGREVLFGVTMDMCDRSTSHLRSAAEAAWRGDLDMLSVHLLHAHNALKSALMTYAVIEGEKAKAANDEPAPA